MSYDIEIESRDDEMVVFYIQDTPYVVQIESEITTQEFPVSFNSFNDEITYAEDDVIYHYVLEHTLQCNGINYYDEKGICTELELILNR